MDKKKNIGMLIALFLGYVLISLDKISVSFTLIPMAEQFNLAPSAIGLIMSSFFAGYALMQVPMGLVINKVGSRFVLIFSVVALGTFSLLFGFGSSLLVFMIIRFSTGMIAHSGYPSSASKELTVNFQPNKRTFYQGILLSSTGFAGVLGPMIFSPLITKMGWQVTYFLISGLAILVAIILIIAFPKSEEIIEQKDNVKANTEKISIFTVWSDSRVWILFVNAFFINCILYGFSNWIPSYLITERSMPLTDIGLVIAVAGVFALVGSIGGSYVVGKYFQKLEKQIVATTAILGSVIMFSAYFTVSASLLALSLGIANFFLSISFVTMMSIPLKIFTGDCLAPSFATLSTGGILGGFVSPTLIGMLVQLSGSFITTFIFFLVVGVLSAVAILLLR